jgi:antitoxin (DNA-binding transcriptional repressor) of toxin-antitoxin stability system
MRPHARTSTGELVAERVHFTNVPANMDNVVVTLHGEPVAEIRPLEQGKGGIEERVKELIARGVLIPAKGPKARAKPGKPVPGALRRLLDDRGE